MENGEWRMEIGDLKLDSPRITRISQIRRLVHPCNLWQDQFGITRLDDEARISNLQSQVSIVLNKASIVGSMTSGAAESRMAVSGSLRPWPVSTHTTRL